MSYSVLKPVAAITLGSLIAVAGWAHGGSDDAASLPDGVKKQDAKTALRTDIALLAEGKGIPPRAAARAVEFQERFLQYAQKMVADHPDQVSRIWLEPAPKTQGYIEFIREVPKGNPPKGVELLGNGRISREHHTLRAEIAADALKAKGYVNFLTFFDAAAGKIRVEFAVERGAPKPKKGDVFDVVRQGIGSYEELAGAAVEVRPSDLDVRVIERAGEIYTFDHSRGGNRLLDGGGFECTSGWSVDGPNGDGIVTAAHCTGLDQFEEPGVTPYGMTWRRQERDKGDAEYHTTTHIELAEFYATATSIRDVKSTKATIWMFPGNSVCVYGRSSNIRDCTHDIEATGVTVTFTDGVTVRKLARASGDSSIGGDSGGGWSWNTKAWGVHSGSNDVDSYFTPIGRVERELDVDVKIAP